MEHGMRKFSLKCERFDYCTTGSCSSEPQKLSQFRLCLGFKIASHTGQVIGKSTWDKLATRLFKVEVFVATDQPQNIVASIWQSCLFDSRSLPHLLQNFNRGVEIPLPYCRTNVPGLREVNRPFGVSTVSKRSPTKVVDRLAVADAMVSCHRQYRAKEVSSAVARSVDHSIGAPSVSVPKSVRRNKRRINFTESPNQGSEFRIFFKDVEILLSFHLGNVSPSHRRRAGQSLHGQRGLVILGEKPCQLIVDCRLPQMLARQIN